MSVIIRLQNLPWSANALDIRQYFRGLSIPEGGVHIVGGELGDAFIAFSTDEDARQAFNMNGGKIKEVQIKLLLSSRTEMQKVIEAARNPSAFAQTVAPQPLTLQVSQIASCQNLLLGKLGKLAKLENKEEKKEKKRGRSRSRSRERRRDRSRDRSRDRKERRRRDRSHSRDRRDRHRRDRSRSRNRSRTHDRSRSRDRDSYRRDKKKDNIDDRLNGDVSSSSTTITDFTEGVPNNMGNMMGDNSWDPQLMNSKLAAMSGRGNGQFMPGFPRDSAGSTSDLKEGANDFRSRDSWPPAHQAVADRFNRNSPAQSMSGSYREMEMELMRNRGAMYDNMIDSRDGNNSQDGRPSRHNTSGPSYSPYDDSMDSSSSHGYNDRSNDSYRGGRDSRERRDVRDRDRDNKMTDRESKLNYPSPGCCVKIRIGRMGYGDVRRFFQGLFISSDGVKLINDQEGRRTGVAFVRFVRQQGKIEALQRNGALHRGTPAEVVHCDDQEFENAIDSYMPPPSIHKEDKVVDRMPHFGEKPRTSIADESLPCVTISNLPQFTKEHDIITMIGDFPLVSVLMVMNKVSEQLVYLQFVKPEDASRFYNMKEKHFVNGQKVLVKQISEKVFQEVKRQHNNGNGVVDIPDESQFDKKTQDSNNGMKPVQIISDCIVLKGLPPKTSDRDIIDFFSDIGLVPSRIHVPLGKSNKPSFCYCEFSDPMQASQATAKNGTSLGMAEVFVELIPRREMEQLIGIAPSADTFNNANNYQFPGPNMNQPQRRPLLGNNGGPQRGPNGPPGQQFIPDAFRMPGCVISLENVPFRAGINEILDFFSDYNIPEENVMRRFNDRGHATGDARVAFSSPLEAQRAFSELRHGKIRDRTIFMHLQ